MEKTLLRTNISGIELRNTNKKVNNELENEVYLLNLISYHDDLRQLDSFRSNCVENILEFVNHWNKPFHDWGNSIILNVNWTSQDISFAFGKINGRLNYVSGSNGMTKRTNISFQCYL